MRLGVYYGVVEVVVTDEFKEWWEALDNDDAVDVARVIDLLEAEGTALGFPYSSGIRESRFPLRELRIQSRGRPIRVFYAFGRQDWRRSILRDICPAG
jgi:hypothetical protein